MARARRSRALSSRSGDCDNRSAQSRQKPAQGSVPAIIVLRLRTLLQVRERLYVKHFRHAGLAQRLQEIAEFMLGAARLAQGRFRARITDHLAEAVFLAMLLLQAG